MPQTVLTHCHYCTCLCGVRVQTEHGQVQSIEPDRSNPYTWRDFCRKGMTAGEVIQHPRRLLTPMKRVGDRYVPATYEEAVEDISRRMTRIIDEHGPDAMGTYHGNPLGFNFGGTIFFSGLQEAIGTGNRFYVASVDQNSLYVVAEAMYGSPVVSLLADIDESDCFLLIGMDPAQSKFGWVDVTPDGWSRVLAAQQRGADIIVVDPRCSTSAKAANKHLAVRPGQDWALLMGLLYVIFDEKLERASTAVALSGVNVVRSLALESDLGDLAARCNISVADIREVARRFARAPRAVCLTHTGTAHTATGTLTEWLGHVLNAVTDRLDTPGGKRFEPGYFPITKFKTRAAGTRHRTRLRDQPTIAGFHALAELPDEIMTPGPGQIRGMMMVAGNPVISGPDGAVLDEALSRLDLLVSVDLMQRTSHRHAHWLIPGSHWLERQGLHVLLGCLTDKPYVQYAQRAVHPPAGVKEEWEFFVDLALALDRPLFGKKGINTLARASRALARWTGKPALAMNPAWIERMLVASGKRLKFRDILSHPHGWIYGEKTYGELQKILSTPSKTVECAPARFVAAYRQLVKTPASGGSREYPLLLVNRRSRESMNSWLNEVPGLHVQQRRNAVEMHPLDAADLRLDDGLMARVSSDNGQVDLPVRVVEGGSRGVVTIAHGWGSEVFDPTGQQPPISYGVNRNLLTTRFDLDPLSQIPAFNGTPVRVEPLGEHSA